MPSGPDEIASLDSPMDGEPCLWLAAHQNLTPLSAPTRSAGFSFDSREPTSRRTGYGRHTCRLAPHIAMSALEPEGTDFRTPITRLARTAVGSPECVLSGFGTRPTRQYP